jgi:phospholipase C
MAVTRLRNVAGVVAAMAVVLAALGTYPEAVAASPVEPGTPVTSSAVQRAKSPIDHVVIIYEENHSFDDILGQLCLTRTTPCNGYTGRVRFADGVIAPNVTEPDIVPQAGHGKLSQRQALADKWDLLLGCQRTPYKCVTHVDPAGIPNIAALANRFAVSDATFGAYVTASYGAHVQLAGGTLDGFISGSNPVNSRTGARPGPGWGCNSKKDVQWRNGKFVPSCIPSPDGGGPYRASPVPYRATIMQRIESAGLSWHIYQGNFTTHPADHAWSICPYFNWCLKNRFDLAHDSNTASFIQAASGTRPLPNVSFVLPLPATSQHNLTSLAWGDNYIGRIMNAVQRGPHWRSTAVFITWDDCGCFYDHVKPPPGMSLRNPMIVVSPWVKPVYTDSRIASQPYSMLAFIGHNFGLSSLSPSVSAVYDYANVFDFTQDPLAGIPMTHTPIPRTERARLAHLAPLIRDDPT